MHEARLPEGLPSAWLLDCEVFADAIAPDPDLTISQWAEERRILTSLSKEPGPWRTARVPYAREIMDELSPRSPTQEVTFAAGTQVTKTEIGNNFLGFVMDWAPGPIMMVRPTSQSVKRGSKLRIKGMIESVPTLAGKISESSRDGSNSETLKEFPGGVLILAGANSASDLKSEAVRYLFEDELDEYPDDVDGQGPADELAEKRTDTYSYKRKIYRASTPTEAGRSKIWKHWLRSDRRRYHVPCPHCDEVQVLKWAQMRWTTRSVYEVTLADSGEIVEVPPGTEGAAERDTGELLECWYDCEACSERIDEHHKTAMLAAGKWIKENPHSRRAGFHLSALYSPLGWYSWATAVEKRLEADKDPTGVLLKAWTNTVLAEPYAGNGESVSDLDLKARAEGYRLGAVPMGGLMLSASVDVQGNRLEVKVKAWGRGEESWLVDYQVFHGDTETAAPWEALDLYLGRSFPHECGAELRILATGVDAGYRTQTVLDWCRRRRNRHVFPLRGQSQAGKAVLGRPSAQDIDHKGIKIPNGVELWPIGTDTAKTEIYARLQIQTLDEKGRPAGGPGAMHFPLGLPDDYYKQLSAERLVTKYIKGYPRRVWEKDAGERNEALDLEVYAYAAAIYAGLKRARWDQIESGMRLTAGDLFVDAARRRAQQAEAGAKDQPISSVPPAVAIAPAAALPAGVPYRPPVNQGRRVRHPGVRH